jgi:hypothetical protein
MKTKGNGSIGSFLTIAFYVATKKEEEGDDNNDVVAFFVVL